MNILALTSQKGGSGKTTLVGHLAVAAEIRGAGPVAVIDTDPQGSLVERASAAHPVLSQRLHRHPRP
jgi:chromosome partitioning protein